MFAGSDTAIAKQYDGNAVGMLWNWCRYLDNKKESDIMTSVITCVIPSSPEILYHCCPRVMHVRSAATSFYLCRQHCFPLCM